MSDNLTPTAQAILDRLREHPATAADLRQQTGRSRSTIDKALTDLAKTGLITKTRPESGEDDGPTQWTITDHDQPDGQAAEHAEPSHAFGTDTAPDIDLPTAESTESSDDADGPAAGPPDAEDRAKQPLPDGTASGPDAAPDAPTSAADATPPAEAAENALPPLDEVKVCRGCGEQMPKTCPSCQQKTTAYCGTCRKTQPTRRRNPGEPEILANGLPKLRPGELERLVLDVIRTQPLPDHLGITGWTPGRVAIFLPGRSTGAISNALDKLTSTGQAQLIGDNPKRYQPTPMDEPADQSDDEQQTDTATDQQ